MEEGLTAFGPKKCIGLAALGPKIYIGQPAPETQGLAYYDLPLKWLLA